MKTSVKLLAVFLALCTPSMVYAGKSVGKNARKAKTNARSSSKTDKKASTKGKRSLGSAKTSSTRNRAGNVSSRSSGGVAQTTATQTTPSVEKIKEIVGTASCDSQYTRCMNRYCSNVDIGKCVCYEDKGFNNKESEFINVDGTKIAQGFEFFNYAKRQCSQILDNCIDDKRSISTKYKNLVQRDCLMLSDKDLQKGTGISRDYNELKECVKPACTLKDNLSGYELFDFPEYSLCFNDAVAKFSMDAYCSDIIAKSETPLTLKQMFLDEMALRREKSCISMHGELSNDRKKCYVNISYGINKDNIKFTQKFAVGEYMECSASTFGTKNFETKDAKKARLNKILSMTATGLNAAGAVLGIAGMSDPIGGVVNSGIDIAEAGVDLGFSIQDYKDGKLDATQLTDSIVSSATTITMSSISVVGSVGEIANAAKVAKGAKTASVAVQAGSGTAQMAVGTAQYASGKIDDTEFAQKMTGGAMTVASAGVSASTLGKNTASIEKASKIAKGAIQATGGAATMTIATIEHNKGKIDDVTYATKMTGAGFDVAIGGATVGKAINSGPATRKVVVAYNEKVPETSQSATVPNSGTGGNQGNNGSGSTSGSTTGSQSSGTATSGGTTTTTQSSGASSSTSSGAKDGNDKRMTQQEFTKKTKLAGVIRDAALDLTSQAVDYAFTEKINAEQKIEEVNAITKHAVVDRDAGSGYVNMETVTQHGNCFINNEWFATENEQTLLLWKN